MGQRKEEPDVDPEFCPVIAIGVIFALVWIVLAIAEAAGIHTAP